MKSRLSLLPAIALVAVIITLGIVILARSVEAWIPISPTDAFHRIFPRQSLHSKNIIDAINDFRASQGQSKLTFSHTLSSDAHIRSLYTYQNKYGKITHSPYHAATASAILTYTEYGSRDDLISRWKKEWTDTLLSS